MSTPHRLAWSTRSATNGYIYRWSRWHLAHKLVMGELTLCGKKLPYAKWVVRDDGGADYFIKGGECLECARIANNIKTKGAA